MLERRRETRTPVNYQISLSHPLLGRVTAEVLEVSRSGLSLSLEESTGFYTMMELDARISDDGQDGALMELPIQVVRVQNRKVAVRFNTAQRKRHL